MNKLTIEKQKIMVDAMIKAFRNIPVTAITFSNIKKN